MHERSPGRRVRKCFSRKISEESNEGGVYIGEHAEGGDMEKGPQREDRLMRLAKCMYCHTVFVLLHNKMFCNSTSVWGDRESEERIQDTFAT